MPDEMLEVDEDELLLLDFSFFSFSFDGIFSIQHLSILMKLSYNVVLCNIIFLYAEKHF